MISNINHEEEIAVLGKRLADALSQVNRLKMALMVERDHLLDYTNGSTHWSGCEQHHSACRALKRIETVLQNENTTPTPSTDER